MYYLVYGLFYLLSLLPFWLMYLLSDGIAFLLYHVIRYRRKVVENNLAIAFPEKTVEERRNIARDFYRYFSDNWIEVIKMISISKKELTKRFTGDYDVINNLYTTGRNVQVHMAHLFNWEYANMAFGQQTIYPLLVVYKPIYNQVINRLFYKVRTRFGSNMLSAYNFKKEFAPFMRKPFTLVLVADQKTFPRQAYWMPFFGKMATFVQGPERTARLNNAVVIMASIHRVKRGYYRAELELLTNSPRSMPHGEITRKMGAFMEEAIRRQPANYLWSHKRWKHQFDPAQHTSL